MKTIGLIGGMSWESTASYYRLINQAVKTRLGGLHSASLLLHSVDFAGIEQLQRAGDWDAAGAQLAQAARGLQAAGAGALLICANTMHRVAPAIALAVQIPLLHVVDATAAAVCQAGVRRVGLLGTRFTMEQPFYVERLQQQGLEVRLPDADDRAMVHRVIYEELCQGQLLASSRDNYRRVMAALVAQGAEGIILGCTEIALLVDASDATVPLFDTTELHAQAAVDWALADA
jgi:aspartate racemase